MIEPTIQESMRRIHLSNGCETKQPRCIRERERINLPWGCKMEWLDAGMVVDGVVSSATPPSVRRGRTLGSILYDIWGP